MNYVEKLPRWRVGTAALAALFPLIAACGGDGSSASSAADGTPADDPAAESSIPPGTTLRVADQSDTLSAVFGAAGLAEPNGYEISYSDFEGGPPMLQAFEAGEIDIGYVADTPLIFAQAGGQDVVGIAAWATEQSGLSLVTAPGVEIDSFADVAGHSVAYQRGTVLQAVVLQGLDANGLGTDEIEHVDIPFPQLVPALQGGQVDAAVLGEPLTSTYLADNPDATLVERATDITDRTSFIIASRRALDDPAKSAAIAEFLDRLVRSYSWADDNPRQFAEAFYGERYGIDGEQAAAYRQIVGDTTFVELPGDLLEPQQRLADLYHDAGEIPEQLDVVEQFDGRFNAVIRAASGTSS